MSDTPKRVNFFKSIKLKAWFGIFIMTILPITLLGVYAFEALSGLSRDILIESNIQAFKQVKYEVDQYVSTFDELINYLASDENFTKPGQLENAIENMRHLDQSYEGIERIIFVDAEGNLLAHSKREDNLFGQMSFAEKSLAKSKNQSFLFAPEAFLIKSKVSEAPDSPCVIATISFFGLRKSLEGITFGTNFRYYLVTESGENILEQPNFPRDVIAGLMDQPCGAYDLLPGFADGIPKIVISLPILHFGLRIFVFQEAGDVYSIARTISNKTLYLIIFLCIASFILAIYLSWYITEPVAIIADKAIKLSEGQNDVKVDIESDDEIGFLSRCFNSMSQKITRKITEVNALYKVTNYISTSSNSTKALDLCLEHIIDIFKAKRGSIMLINNERMTLVVESFKLAKTEPDNNNENINSELNNLDMDETTITPVKFELKIGEGIAGKVVSSGEPILCMDCLTDDRFKDYSTDKSKTPKTLVAVPLRIQNKVIGVVNLADRSDSQPFNNSDLELLQAIVDQMALSIDNARLHDLSVVNEQTDLYLRKFLDIRLDDEIKRAKRFGFPLSVAIFSIDDFNDLNSKFGKFSCEAALYDVAKLLKQTVRATDIPAEYDYNKICVVLAHTSDEQAKMFADRFIDKMKNTDIVRDNKKFNITLSCGICQYSTEIGDYVALLNSSNKALEESLKTGNLATIFNKKEKEQDNA